MAATSDPPVGDEPTRSLEIELTFDVDDDAHVPDLSGLPGVAVALEPDVRDLDARYFDSATLDLARAGYAVRRRTGGPDAGWHIKGPRVDGGRVELGWPLDENDRMPPAVRAELQTVTDAALGPIARILNTRTAYVLQDAAAGVVAEFVDDRVTARDERDGVERRWREWEFELGPAAPPDPAGRAHLLQVADTVIRAAGGRDAASSSKLARALGA